nr:MAG TPA: hypothetical protein [Caudoviricetes sp.]
MFELINATIGSIPQVSAILLLGHIIETLVVMQSLLKVLSSLVSNSRCVRVRQIYTTEVQGLRLNRFNSTELPIKVATLDASDHAVSPDRDILDVMQGLVSLYDHDTKRGISKRRLHRDKTILTLLCSAMQMLILSIRICDTADVIFDSMTQRLTISLDATDRKLGGVVGRIRSYSEVLLRETYVYISSLKLEVRSTAIRGGAHLDNSLQVCIVISSNLLCIVVTANDATLCKSSHELRHISNEDVGVTTIRRIEFAQLVLIKGHRTANDLRRHINATNIVLVVAILSSANFGSSREHLDVLLIQHTIGDIRVLFNTSHLSSSLLS